MKKPLQAIAIEYGNNPVPLVVAKGKDDLAQQIIDAAIAAGVPIKKDEELAALLGLLDIDEQVPRSLYTLVAEVLVYTYWLKGMKPGDEKGVWTWAYWWRSRMRLTSPSDKPHMSWIFSPDMPSLAIRIACS